MSRFLILIGCLFYLVSLSADVYADKVAYLAHTKGFWQVWIMKPDGSNKQQITRSAYDKSHISWFPDGVYVLVNGNQGRLKKVNTITLQESNIELPIKGTVDAVISPSGKHIAFSLSVAGSIDNNHIWLVEISSRKLIKLTNMPGLQHEPVWSFGSEWVYFLSGKGKQAHDIWRVSVKDKFVEQITSSSLYHFDLAFSKQGDMFFSNNRTGNYELWLQTKNGEEKPITDNLALDARPTLSSSGEEVIFESSRTGVMNIWRKSLHNGDIVQLTDESIGARYPIWWQNK